MYNQIAMQRAIAQSWGFGYELLVQEEWQVVIAAVNNLPVKKACPSQGVEPPQGEAKILMQLLQTYGYIYLDVIE